MKGRKRRRNRRGEKRIRRVGDPTISTVGRHSRCRPRSGCGWASAGRPRQAREARPPDAQTCAAALPCTCCTLERFWSVQQVHERGARRHQFERPAARLHVPCVLDRRDAHPQPLRGRQRLWRPMSSGASVGGPVLDQLWSQR